MRCFDLCLAQSADDAERLRDLGAPRVPITGNLKLDVPAAAGESPTVSRELRAAIGGRPVIAAASTHPGEETAMIEAHRRLRGTLSRSAHHHRAAPSRARPGHCRHRRSRGPDGALRSRGELPEPHTDIYVADTIGELGLFYRLAPIVFMGGSLVPHGGQNPIEPAKLGAAILHGPHVWNFAEIYAALDAVRGAEEVADVGQLVGAHGCAAAGRRCRAPRWWRRAARPSTSWAAPSTAPWRRSNLT